MQMFLTSDSSGIAATSEASITFFREIIFNWLAQVLAKAVLHG